MDRMCTKRHGQLQGDMKNIFAFIYHLVRKYVLHEKGQVLRKCQTLFQRVGIRLGRPNLRHHIIAPLSILGHPCHMAMDLSQQTPQDTPRGRIHVRLLSLGIKEEARYQGIHVKMTTACAASRGSSGCVLNVWPFRYGQSMDQIFYLFKLHAPWEKVI